jgi:high-affinity nickel-transport protein
MNFAYGWAFSNPLRKIFYNIVITALSVAVALVIGTVELGGLLAQKLGARGPFWGWLENIDIGSLGMIIVAMFLGTWVLALSIWHFGHLEERWAAPRPAGDQASGV